MIYAVVLPIDDKKIQKSYSLIWESLAKAEICNRQRALGYVPHVTLSSLDKEPSSAVLDKIEAVVHDIAPIPLQVRSFSPLYIPGKKAALVARMERNETVNALQKAVFGVCPSIRSYDNPPSWMGHTTLTGPIPTAKLAQAVGCIVPDFTSYEATADRVALAVIEDRPGKLPSMRELKSFKMGG